MVTIWVLYIFFAFLLPKFCHIIDDIYVLEVLIMMNITLKVVYICKNGCSTKYKKWCLSNILKSETNPI